MSSPDRHRKLVFLLAALVCAAFCFLALDRSRAIAQSGIGPPGLSWKSGPKRLIPPKQQNPPPP